MKPILPIVILAIEDEGEREFMSWLYIQYHTLLYSEIMKIVHNQDNATDILQDVVEKLIDRIPLLRRFDNRGLVNYIITAAKHTAYNFCRDNRKELLSNDIDAIEGLSDSGPSLEDCLIKREQLLTLSNVWNTLDEKTQYLLQAKYVLNMSGKEIAEELGVSPDSVRMALVRSKRKARFAMQQWENQNE